MNREHLALLITVAWFAGMGWFLWHCYQQTLPTF